MDAATVNEEMKQDYLKETMQVRKIARIKLKYNFVDFTKEVVTPLGCLITNSR